MSKSLVVVGSGQMGSGIAQVAAQTGEEVIVFDTSSEALERSAQSIEKSLVKFHSKGALKEDPSTILKRIQYSSRLEDLKNREVHLLIEAVTENFEVKASIFESMDTLLPSECIFASNTSSISITKLASRTQRPERFVGMHFMNPVPIMKLVELISGEKTHPETLKSVEDLAKKMGKITVKSKDMPGFIVNRVLMPMINEACFALQDGLATAEDIDIAMKLGTNQPMGPLALADFIGLDTCLYIIGVLYEGFGTEKYAPCPLLEKYVKDGRLGKKVGRGIFEY